MCAPAGRRQAASHPPPSNLPYLPASLIRNFTIGPGRSPAPSARESSKGSLVSRAASTAEREWLIRVFLELPAVGRRRRWLVFLVLCPLSAIDRWPPLFLFGDLTAPLEGRTASQQPAAPIFLIRDPSNDAACRTTVPRLDWQGVCLSARDMRDFRGSHMKAMLTVQIHIVGCVILGYMAWVLATSITVSRFLSGTLIFTYSVLGVGFLFFLTGLVGWVASARVPSACCAW
ncbi:Tetraspanin-15 [Penaeus vannamei]|uniref:Tetraspanin-15 n=1 Tax=Penaeus vannamei TaxID=6689 RepID=A0A423TAP8_PENVA|nr:Tetraspanin-15 [Penaeus vannamei]